jgi:hypothetical protein
LRYHEIRPSNVTGALGPHVRGFFPFFSSVAPYFPPHTLPHKTARSWAKFVFKALRALNAILAFGSTATIQPSRAAVFVDGNYVGHAGELGGAVHALLISPGNHHIKVELAASKPTSPSSPVKSLK